MLGFDEKSAEETTGNKQADFSLDLYIKLLQLAMNDVLPNYVNPCLSERQDSIESFWRYPSDFGECYPPPSDRQVYPRLIPVYNGKVLDLHTDFVHASLSGISIKHYYGKCMKDPEEDEELQEKILFGDGRTEAFDYDWFDDDAPSTERREYSQSMKNTTNDQPDFSGSSTESSGSFEYRSFEYMEGQPLCTLPRINYRNSFWNIHRPELCKLTWGQKYVGKSTVTEHLHEHLLQHGALCAGFHTQEDRAYMLNRELDEYVRLKVVQESRKLPPDEPLFDFRLSRRHFKAYNNPKCRTPPVPQVIVPINENERFVPLSDDEEEETTIRRSKEEFCLTIGRHIRKPPMVQEEELASEEYITPQLSETGEEEVGGIFYYNWFLFQDGEEQYEGESDNKLDSVSMSMTSDAEPLGEPCPPLMMDEFCRAAGKVDFSDVRCDPDF